jgi:hypothetical protein
VGRDDTDVTHHEVAGTAPADISQPAAATRRPRAGRLAAMAVLTLYGVLLAMASFELVPLPASWSALRGLTSDAAAMTRRVGLVPGLPLFHDRDRTPIEVLTNCVEIVAVQPDGSRRLRHATSTCAERPGPALLRGSLDKALVRLQFDALVFRDVPPSGWPMSGDRVLAAIGHQYCGQPEPRVTEEIRYVWSQAVEDRRTGRRDVVVRGAARWSCADRRLVERWWQPSLDATTASGARPISPAWPDP